MVGALAAHRADQPGAALAGQREDGQEVGLVEIDVQLAVQRRAGRVDVGDVEHLPVGAARKAGADPLAHRRARAVAAGEIGGLAGALAVRPAQPGDDPIALVAEAGELGPALDLHAGFGEALDQQPLVLVLREDQQERVGRQRLPDHLEANPRRVPAAIGGRLWLDYVLLQRNQTQCKSQTSRIRCDCLYWNLS